MARAERSHAGFALLCFFDLAHRNMSQPSKNREDEFAKEAELAPVGIVREFWEFLWDYKVCWITPIVLSLLAFGVLAALSTSTVAPFIYTLF